MEDLGCLLAHYLDLVCLPLLSESNATKSILYLIRFLGDIIVCGLRFKSITSSGLGFRDLRMMDYRRRLFVRHSRDMAKNCWQNIILEMDLTPQCCQEMTIRTFECIELLSRSMLYCHMGKREVDPVSFHGSWRSGRETVAGVLWILGNGGITVQRRPMKVFRLQT